MKTIKTNNKMNNTKNTQPTEIEFNRVVSKFRKNQQKILNQLDEIISDLPDKTYDEMDSRIDIKSDKDLICGSVNGKIKKDEDVFVYWDEDNNTMVFTL
jgi:hypothetical protein